MHSIPSLNVVDLMLDAVCLVNVDSTIVFVSPAFERIFGYQPEEVVGKRMLDMVHPDDLAITQRQAKSVTEGNLQLQFENRYLRKDGTIAHIRWTARWLPEQQVRLAVAHDITERRLTFQGVDGPLWVEHLLTGLPGGQLGFLIVVNIMVFFLAFFLDFFELSFIVVPLLAPVAHKLGIDLIWFGVLLAVNMQTSFMHPPFGFALFYLRSVAPAKEYMDKVTKKMIAPVTTPQIYWGAIPFL